LRSVADPTDFWAEEPITRESEIKRQDFFDIVGSLRNSHGVQTQFHFTFNPISKQTWIYRDFFESQLYDVETLFVNYWDNPYCPQPTITFLESLKQLDPKRYEVDALGNWGIAYEGLIYRDYESVGEIPDHQFYGLDFGHNDPTALVAGYVLDVFDQPKKDYIVKELLYESGHTSSTLIQRFNQLGIKKTVKMICDNSRPEMILDLKRAGYRAEACHKYSGSVRDGIDAVKNYSLKIVSGSRNIFDEISTYVWDSEDESLLDDPAPNQLDHTLDALRYGLESVKRPQPKYYNL
jgi:phage terminase large subunit